VPLDEVAQDQVAQSVGLGVEVRALPDGHHPRAVDRRIEPAQRSEIGARRIVGEGGQRPNGGAAEPGRAGHGASSPMRTYDRGHANPQAR
jgi:hypothetical protein